MSDPTYDDRVRSVILPPELVKRIQQFADANGMSKSEVIREAMAGFVTGEYKPRKRVTKRVTIWIHPDEYVAFTKKVRESDRLGRKKGEARLTIQHALELALEEIL